MNFLRIPRDVLNIADGPSRSHPRFARVVLNVDGRIGRAYGAGSRALIAWHKKTWKNTWTGRTFVSAALDATCNAVEAQHCERAKEAIKRLVALDRAREQ